jgi:hypothetical protein
LWMLGFLIPADVRSNFMMPLLVTAIGANSLLHPRSPRPGQHIKEHSPDCPRPCVEVTGELRFLPDSAFVS